MNSTSTTIASDEAITAVATPRPTLPRGYKSDDFIDTLYTEMRRLAAARLRRLRPGQTLQPTELVHEAYLRLQHRNVTWQSRAHFFGAAARAMRNVLVEHARRRRALKRGGDKLHVDITITLPDEDVPMTAEELLTLHEGLACMQKDHKVHTELVLLHYFGGLKMNQIAEITETPLRTVQRRMRFARAWLKDYFEAGESECAGETTS